MFDIGFSELLLLGVVALIVLGPERLPVAMRTLGRYYAKIRQTLNNLQDTVNQELKLVELKEEMQKELEMIRQTELRMKEELDKINLHMQQGFSFSSSSSVQQFLHQDHQTETGVNEELKQVISDDHQNKNKQVNIHLQDSNEST